MDSKIKTQEKTQEKPTIDTLVLSGGGPSGIAYFGCFQSLFEHKILNENLDGIKEIITTSIGILSSFCLLLRLNMSIGKGIALGYDTIKMLDLESISIDDILVDYGLFRTDGIANIFRSILKNMKGIEDINLKDLYDLTKINLTVKVFNVTKKQLEYISYETNPDLSIVKLAEMTTAIPFFFKPVEYNDCLYVDGGLRGHFPIEECKSDNYLGIFIKGGCSPSSALFELLPILEFVYSLMINQDQLLYDIRENIIDPKIIFIDVNRGLDFEITENDKLEIIQKGYDIADLHFKTHWVKDKA